jgi:hypothetical protein
MKRLLAAVLFVGLCLGSPLATRQAVAEPDLPNLSTPAVTQVNANDVWVFARGTDCSLQVNKRFSGSWTGFASLGGCLVGDPTVTVAPENVANVVVRGTDNFAYYNVVQAGSASGFTQVPGLQVKSRVESIIAGGLRLFARGPDDRVYTNQFSGGCFGRQVRRLIW